MSFLKIDSEEAFYGKFVLYIESLYHKYSYIYLFYFCELERAYDVLYTVGFNVLFKT